MQCRTLRETGQTTISLVRAPLIGTDQAKMPLDPGEGTIPQVQVTEPRGNRHAAPGSRAGTRHNRPAGAHHGVRHGNHSKARPPAHRPHGHARHAHQHHNGHDWRWELGHWVGWKWVPGHWVIVIRL